jgi:hypothetical protein
LAVSAGPQTPGPPLHFDAITLMKKWWMAAAVVALAGLAAPAQAQPGKADVKKLEAELEALKAKIKDVEAKIKTATAEAKKAEKGPGKGWGRGRFGKKGPWGEGFGKGPWGWGRPGFDFKKGKDGAKKDWKGPWGRPGFGPWGFGPKKGEKGKKPEPKKAEAKPDDLAVRLERIQRELEAIRRELGKK